MSDAVNHPSHYNQDAIEVIDYIAVEMVKEYIDANTEE